MFGRRPSPSPAETDMPATAYRLRAWPELPEHRRTAAIYRAFSRMCQGPVSLRWFIEQTGLAPRAARTLFDYLVCGGDMEVIDLTVFQGLPGRPA